MPELPEVETTVRALRKKARKRVFVDVWTDWGKTIRKPERFRDFKREIIGKQIKDIKRRAKLILFDLSSNKTLLVHQKMTGHLLLGKWEKRNKEWKASRGPLSEKVNTYIHLLFFLDDGQMLALSDLRKFAKVELWNTKELFDSDVIKKLGPEPLSKNFTLSLFKNCLSGKKGKIKQVLMDQNIVAGIGNIYSDEILFEAKINPFRMVPSLSLKELKNIHLAIDKILKKGIELKGESFADWRDDKGEKGFFDDYRKIYQREGERCSRCGEEIERKKIGGRSTHFCPKCQK